MSNTGGAGFISSTSRISHQAGHGRVLDNFCSAKGKSGLRQSGKENLNSSAGISRRCRRREGTRGGRDTRRPCVDHPKSMVDPFSYNDVNINGILVMLQAAAKNKVKRFVFASSSSVYGDTDQFPQRESQYPLLISPYALSKLTGEYYCRIFSEHFTVETVCLRYFNVFGPKQALDDEYAVVVPKFIHCILHDQPPPIFGTGKQSRDFTYIENVVMANYLSATTPGIKHEVFNVANGKDQSVLELVATLNKIIGKSIAANHLPVRAGDVFKTHADISQDHKDPEIPAQRRI